MHLSPPSFSSLHLAITDVRHPHNSNHYNPRISAWLEYNLEHDGRTTTSNPGHVVLHLIKPPKIAGQSAKIEKGRVIGTSETVAEASLALGKTTVRDQVSHLQWADSLRQDLKGWLSDFQWGDIQWQKADRYILGPDTPFAGLSLGQLINGSWEALQSHFKNNLHQVTIASGTPRPDITDISQATAYTLRP